jgi:fucose permease
MAFLERKYFLLYGLLFVVFILFGTSMTIIGATLPRILADFGWAYTQAGAVIAAGAVGYFCASFAAGYLVRTFGPRAVILSACALVVLSLAFFASSGSVVLNFLLSACIGLGQGCFEVVVNWCVLRIDAKGTGRPMNLMHGAFAVGAVAGPFAIGFLMKVGLPWTMVYRGMSGIFALLALAFLFIPFKVLGGAKEEGEKGKGRAGIARHGAYWFGFFALLLYVGAELGVTNWVAEYFVKIFQAPPSEASFMVSLFWMGLLAGRFGIPLLYRGNRQDIVLVGLAVLMTVSILLLSLTGLLIPGPGGRLLGTVFCFLSGLGCSCVYPMVVNFVGGAFPEAQSEAISFAITGGGIGSFAFPFVMASLSSALGIGMGFTVYVVFALFAALACVALVRSVKARKRT